MKVMYIVGFRFDKVTGIVMAYYMKLYLISVQNVYVVINYMTGSFTSNCEFHLR